MSARAVSRPAGDDGARALIADLLAQVKAAGTKYGHLAIKSSTEGRGICNQTWPPSDTPTCLAWKAAVEKAEAWLAEHQEPRQMALMEAVS
jgi:hypothetical protein